MRTITLALIWMLAAAAQTPEVSRGWRLNGDVALSADPASELWAGIPGVYSERSAKDEPTPGHGTEVRARWTEESLYVLFICPYKELYLMGSPQTSKETNKLWERDVAEIFIGADFEKIWQYREYQVSPQGEWVDLEIDKKQRKPEGGWLWNSGFEVAARIDGERKVWYGAMKIPMESITEKPIRPGFEFRVNYFRFQGPPPQRNNIAWRPTGPTGNHHIPEAFGVLRLEQ